MSRTDLPFVHRIEGEWHVFVRAAATDRPGLVTCQICRGYLQRHPEHVGGASGRCRECGCTDYDCSQCVERTGARCWWVEPDLCSACAEPP